mgnify:CR=1 FL=1
MRRVITTVYNPAFVTILSMADYKQVQHVDLLVGFPLQHLNKLTSGLKPSAYFQFTTLIETFCLHSVYHTD